MAFNKILLQFFRLLIGSRFKKPWTVNAKRPKQNFIKKKLTIIGKGGVPFNRRGCMSFKILKNWPSEAERTYQSHEPSGGCCEYIKWCYIGKVKIATTSTGASARPT